MKSSLENIQRQSQMNSGQQQPAEASQQTQLTQSGQPSPSGMLQKVAHGQETRVGGCRGLNGVATPQTAAEATVMAENLVGDLLPHSVQVWLHDTEYHQLVAASVGGKPPAKPELTPEESSTVRDAVLSLSDILRPARDRGPELDALIAKMFAAFNIYTGDQGKINAMVEVWADELEEFPMYAIRKAYKWAIRGGDKLPSLAAFIADVRLAIGDRVLTRKRLLQQLMNQ